ncbi:MAG: ATP-binding cassette domain-containing protein [Candidatus Methanoperedens sp.]|uniref:ATP-binding cassette domain-containing protein n=1 Tax=Candidatus Methanoperedens sp. BLZ2 TaxID=2035255 RepID=UPI000BE33E20|nr:ATP-binding cassette domain-containing protein [Candidatus Methanoperedens sp. BLZ2]KAB2944420.1 MAG: ABC transporter ATP-binding protein [Candidatus Methanoperedens sp.]MBZ0174939.1 ATP-binding cassette domain-containing protein [Candidatus Methanoperedens nitroreducens]MCX9079772.1 ATP-binding cassette domain-containing protein [Candidatus Methanoperedens sp.]
MVIKTEALTKTFGKITAVNELNLEVNEGEIFGLLGPNGAGKTTLISMLCTILKPTSGRAWVNGFDIVKEQGKVRKSIGIVFQQASVDDLLTGRENLALHNLLFEVPKAVRSQRIDEVLSIVNLEKRADDFVNTYSGGMRRRLELARGIMHHPKILFLDEPTLGLDPQTRDHIWDYIKDLAQKECMTILLTTHYMDEAEQLCDRVAIIDYGKIVALDSPVALKKKIIGDVVSLKQKTSDIERIRKLDYVIKVEEKEGVLLISIKDAGKHLQDLLLNTGPIDFVEVRRGTLNDVFLHYTGRDIREAEAEGGFWERVMKR